jgi:type 1 glutamine amidotransferase
VADHDDDRRSLGGGTDDSQAFESLTVFWRASAGESSPDARSLFIMKIPLRFLRLFAFAVAVLPLCPAFAATAQKKVLVVTVTTGFRHSCIPVSEKILEQLAKDSGKFSVEFVRQPEGMPRPPARPRPGKSGATDPAHEAALKKFAADEKAFTAEWTPKIEAALQALSPANLKKYDAVIFASTTGDLPLPDKQGFVDWVASGKGFVGVHAATDTFHPTGEFTGFAPYTAMIGGAFKTHGAQVSVDCINQDSSHAACAHLPAKWTVFDEIYQFKSFERSKVHGLLTLDKHPNDGTPGDYPVAWSKMHGKGRVFYTSLGHREDVWDPAFADKAGRKNPPEVARQFQQHVLNGILWTLGLAPGSGTP